jgi:hypothetical protein
MKADICGYEVVDYSNGVYSNTTHKVKHGCFHEAAEHLR